MHYKTHAVEPKDLRHDYKEAGVYIQFMLQPRKKLRGVNKWRTDPLNELMGNGRLGILSECNDEPF